MSPSEYQKQKLTVQGKKIDLHVNSDQKQVCTLKLSSLATNLTLKWAIAKLDLNGRGGNMATQLPPSRSDLAVEVKLFTLLVHSQYLML